MAQVTSGVRSVLSRPWVYDLFQDLMGASKGRRALVRDWVRPTAGMRILDVGCGTADILKFLPPDVSYVGFDISPEYIEAARTRFGDRGRFEVGIVDAERAAALPRFDLVLAIGVLHHLDDEVARGFFPVARSVLAPGGRVLTIDPAFADGQPAMARFLVSRDRGRNVREGGAYGALAGGAFARIEGELVHRSWIPYTHWIMECRE